MPQEAKFIDGLIVKSPHANAPEFVIAKLSIKREELINWLQAQEGEWINADIKRSQKGSLYAQVDTWKPNQENQPTSETVDARSLDTVNTDPNPDDIPF